MVSHYQRLRLWFDHHRPGRVESPILQLRTVTELQTFLAKGEKTPPDSASHLQNLRKHRTKRTSYHLLVTVIVYYI